MAVELVFERPFTEWGWKVALYVTCLGIASGGYLSGYAADLLSRNREEQLHGQIAQYGYLVGLVGVVVGPPILLSHLATPLRGALVPINLTNYDSWMAIGAHMIGVFAIGVVLMFGWTVFGVERPHRTSVAGDGDREIATDGGRSDGPPIEAATGDGTVGGVRTVADRVGLLGSLDTLADRTRPSEPVRYGIGGIFGIFAAAVLLYSAMALGSGSTGRVPLWDKTFLIPVQVFGGLAAGLAASVGLAGAVERSFDSPFRTYGLAVAALLAATLVTILSTLTLLAEQSATAAASVDNMLGTYAWLFVGVAVIGGIVIPILASVGAILAERNGTIPSRTAARTYALTAVLVLLGKFALGLTYLMAAEFTPLPAGVPV